MTKAEKNTHMAHYECQTCDMKATVVSTPSSALAWLDHMDTHVLPDNYLVWTWVITPLPGI